jgi:hypothetical protein
VIIDSRFIDMDLTVIPDDQSAGLIEQPPAELLASFGDLPWFDEICADEMVPRSEWKARAEATWPHYRNSVVEIYSQGRTSACVGFACAQALETTFTRRYGRKHRVPLSGMSVYDQIGRSLMSGAYIPDGIKLITELGALPLRTAETAAKYPVTFPGLEYKWRRPSNSGNVSRLFRVTKAAKAQGSEMMASALLKGRAMVIGHARHATPPIGLAFNGNSPLAAYANSWSKSWGDAGFGYHSESVFRNVVGYVILEVSTRPDLDIPVPT